MVPYILNLLDIALTLYALSLGCTELNPIMQSVPFMVSYKVICVWVLCVVLHHFAEGGNKAARWGLRICAAVYAVLACYHLVFLILIGGMIC